MVGAVALVLWACGLAGEAGRAGPPGRDTTVVLDVRHSRFSPPFVRVRPGTTVRFVVRNGDPIDHELIVGPPGVHRSHEAGRDRRHHGDVPGEISVPAGATADTTYRFDRPGVVTFACHLPGHLDYGMKGRVVVA